jgi:hypothetical protein
MLDHLNQAQRHALAERRNTEDTPVLKAEQLPSELQRLLLRKVLRTLARLKALSGINVNVIAEILAKDSLQHGERVATMSVYLEMVSERMARIAFERQCAECGRPMGFDVGPEGFVLKHTPRADARYCSPTCRQKAHRKRHHVTASAQPATTKPSRRNGSHRADNGAGVTAPGHHDDGLDIPEFLRRSAP